MPQERKLGTELNIFLSRFEQIVLSVGRMKASRHLAEAEIAPNTKKGRMLLQQGPRRNVKEEIGERGEEARAVPSDRLIHDILLRYDIVWAISQWHRTMCAWRTDGIRMSRGAR